MKRFFVLRAFIASILVGFAIFVSQASVYLTTQLAPSVGFSDGPEQVFTLPFLQSMTTGVIIALVMGALALFFPEVRAIFAESESDDELG